MSGLYQWAIPGLYWVGGADVGRHVDPCPCAPRRSGWQDGTPGMGSHGIGFRALGFRALDPDDRDPGRACAPFGSPPVGLAAAASSRPERAAAGLPHPPAAGSLRPSVVAALQWPLAARWCCAHQPTAEIAAAIQARPAGALWQVCGLSQAPRQARAASEAAPARHREC